MVTIQFIIPLIVIVLCYGTILWKLSSRTDPSDNSKAQRNDLYQKARKNVAVTFCIVAFFFVVCWVQHQTVWFLFSVGVLNVQWNGVNWQLIVVNMVFLNCTINPIIYLVKSMDFQDALREFLRMKQISAPGNQLTAKSGTQS